jgi:hypothetical protein
VVSDQEPPPAWISPQGQVDKIIDLPLDMSPVRHLAVQFSV